MTVSTKVLIALALLLTLAACGGRPMPFPAPESELGDRPGLFTGDKGVWQIPLPSPSEHH